MRKIGHVCVDAGTNIHCNTGLVEGAQRQAIDAGEASQRLIYATMRHRYDNGCSPSKLSSVPGMCNNCDWSILPQWRGSLKANHAKTTDYLRYVIHYRGK